MSDRPTVVLSFTNKHYNPVSVYWVDDFQKDPLKSLKQQAELDPGEEYLQGSFLADEWVVLDRVSGKLLLQMKARKDEEIIIKGEERRLPAKGSTLDLISAAHRPTEPDHNFALDFDGENDVVIIPHTQPKDVTDPALQNDLHLGPDKLGYEWTLEAWVYRHSNQIEDPIIEKSDAESGGYSLRIGENGRLQAGLMEGTTFLYGEAQDEDAILEARQWYHLAATFQGRTLVKYTDRFIPIWSSPGGRYKNNVVFYRPVPPPGYVRLGDYCEIGVIDADGRQADGTYRLVQRLLVGCAPIADHDDPNFVDGFQRADDFEAIWSSEDPTEPVTIWRPVITGNSDYRALGFIVHPGSESEKPDPALDENAVFLVHNRLRLPDADVKTEENIEWENIEATTGVIGDEDQLWIWPLLGSGFFVASTHEILPPTVPAGGGPAKPSPRASEAVSATPGDLALLDTELIENAYAEIQTYINGQAQDTKLHLSRDVNSMRTTLELNGQNEFLELPAMRDQDYSNGLTFEAWVNFRHDKPTWREADRQNDSTVAEYPIVNLREKTAAEFTLENAQTRNAELQATQDKEQADLEAELNAQSTALTDLHASTTPALSNSLLLTNALEVIATADGATPAQQPEHASSQTIDGLLTGINSNTTTIVEDATDPTKITALVTALKGIDVPLTTAQSGSMSLSVATAARALAAAETALEEAEAAVQAASAQATAASIDGIANPTPEQENAAASANEALSNAEAARDLALALRDELKGTTGPDVTGVVELTTTANTSLSAGEDPTTFQGKTEAAQLAWQAAISTATSAANHPSAVDASDDALQAVQLAATAAIATDSIAGIGLHYDAPNDGLSKALQDRDDAATAVTDFASTLQTAQNALPDALDTKQELLLIYRVSTQQATPTNELILRRISGAANATNGVQQQDVSIPDFLQLEILSQHPVIAVENAAREALSAAQDAAVTDSEMVAIQSEQEAARTAAQELQALVEDELTTQAEAETTPVPAEATLQATLDTMAILAAAAETAAALADPSFTEITTAKGATDALTTSSTGTDIEEAGKLVLAAANSLVTLTDTAVTASRAEAPTPVDRQNAKRHQVALHAATTYLRAITAADRIADARTNSREVTPITVFVAHTELNDWLHLGLTINTAGDLAIYKNGQEVNNQAAVLTTPANLLKVIHWEENRLGANLDDSSFFNGFLAETRLWTRHQDDTRIAGFYQREIGNLPGLAAYWPLNDGPQGDRILDHGEGGLHIQQLKEVESYIATNDQGHFQSALHEHLELRLIEPPGEEGKPGKTIGHLSIECWFRLDADADDAALSRTTLLRHGNNWVVELLKETDTSGATVHRVVFSYKQDGESTWRVAAQDTDQRFNLAGKGWTHLFIAYNVDPNVDEDGNPKPRIRGIYLDGQFQQLENVAGNLPAAASDEASPTFRIGPSSAAGRSLHLAELRLWRTPLPPFASASKRFDQVFGRGLSDEKLFAYWPLDGSGNDPDPSGTRPALSWVNADGSTGTAPDTVFEAYDLKLQPPTDMPHKWNTRSALRLLPISVVPKTTNAPVKLGALEPQNSLVSLGLLKNTHFAGMIDSVRIWRRARTAGEIKANWNQKLTGSEHDDLLRYFRFDEGQGTSASDQSRDSQNEAGIRAGGFGGDNSIRNLRLWKRALPLSELRGNLSGANTIDFPGDDRFIKEIFFATKGRDPQLPAEGEDPDIPNAAQDESVLQSENMRTDMVHLDRHVGSLNTQRSFTIELEVRIDTFVLSGKEHYLVFKQDAWALILYREKGQLYFGFTYDYQQNLQRRDWKRINASKRPVTFRKWAYVAVVGDAGSDNLRIFVDREAHGQRILDDIPEHRTDLFDMRVTNFPMLLGEEGKPKWTLSDLLLMDGLRFDGRNDQLKLPRMLDNYVRGITVEAWIFIGPTPGENTTLLAGAAPPWLPIMDLGKQVPVDPADPTGPQQASDNIILAAERNGDDGPHHLVFRLYRETTHQTVRSEDALPNGEWVHVAATVDKAGKARLFRNAVLIHETDLPNDGTDAWLPRNTSRNEGNTLIGRSNPGSLHTNAHSFWGKIDEVRIWKRPRSSRQLAGYMRRQLPEVHEQLVGMWRFSEGSGIAAYDSTAKGYHALLGDGAGTTNAPGWVIVSERINAGLGFNKNGFVSIKQIPEDLSDSTPLDFTDLSEFTLEAWIRTEDVSLDANTKIIELQDRDGNHRILITYGANITELKIEIEVDGTTASHNFSGTTLAAPAEAVDAFMQGRWTHLAVVFRRVSATATSIELLLHPENAPETPTVQTETLAVAFPATGSLAEITLGQAFIGTLDELRLWNHARSPEQVHANLFCKVDPFDITTPVLATTNTGEQLVLDKEHAVLSAEELAARPAGAPHQNNELLAIQALRIPAGRNARIILRKKESAPADLPKQVFQVFESNTLDIYAGDDFSGVGEGAGTVSGTDVQTHYDIQLVAIGHSPSGGMLGYWPMNENSGRRITDKTMRRNHGLFELPIRQAGDDRPEEELLPQWVETSSIQYDGYRFNGYDEFIEIPHNDRLNPTTDFSLSAWIEPDRFHGLQGIVTKVTDLDNTQFGLSMEGEMLRFDYEKDGSNFALVGGQIKDGWNHVAVTVKTRLIDSAELQGNKEYMLAKAKAFTQVGRLADEVPRLLPAHTRVQDGDTLQNVRSLTIPVTKSVVITWRLRDISNANRSRTSFRPVQIAQAYDLSTDDIFLAFPDRAQSYQVSRADIANLYKVVDIRVNFNTRQRQVRLPKIHLYVNGLLVRQGIAPEETIPSPFNINIGAWGGKVRDYFFHGTIDAITLWDRALSQADIQTLKDDPNPGTDSRLTGFWRPNPRFARTGIPNRKQIPDPDNAGQTKNVSFGLGQLGIYDRSGSMLLYGPRPSREFTATDQIEVNTPLNLSGFAITIEYLFRANALEGGRLGSIFEQIHRNGEGDITGRIHSGFGIDNPRAGANASPMPRLPQHSFSNDPDLAPELILSDPHLNVLDGQWHHIAVTWEQNKRNGFKSYVNGKLIAEGQTGNKPLPKIDTLALIGSDMVGELAEVRIWSVARLGNQIRRDMDRLLLGTEPGLLAYWPLKDSDGVEIRDEAIKEPNPDIPFDVPQPFHATATNEDRQTDNGLFLLKEFGEITLNALSFDGIDDHVHIEDVPGIRFNENFTAEAWIELPCRGPIFSRIVMDETQLNGARWAWKGLFVNDDNQLIFGVRPIRGRPLQLGPVDLPEVIENPETGRENWHHVAISVDRDLSEMRFYVDGQHRLTELLSTTFLRSDPTVLIDEGEEQIPIAISSITVGAGKMTRSTSTPIDYFQGNIGELRLWNTVRSANLIENNFKTALRSDQIGLEGLWRFTKGDGIFVDNVVPEESSAGEIFGATWDFNSGFELFGLEENTEAAFVTDKGFLPPSCLHLDGGSSVMDLGHDPTTNLAGDLTIEVWVYLDNVSGEQTIISKGKQAEFDLSFIGNKLNYAHGGQFRLEWQYEFEEDQWYHLAIIRENGIKLVRAMVNGLPIELAHARLNTTFVDDEPVVNVVSTRIFDSVTDSDERPEGSNQLYGKRNIPRRSGNSLLLGNSADGSTALAGRIMDVRIWNHPLRDSLIALFRGRRLRGDEIGLLAYYPLAYNGNDVDANDTKRLRLSARVPRGFDTTDILQTTTSASGLEGGTTETSLEVSINEPAVRNASSHHEQLAWFELSVGSATNVKRVQIEDDLAARLSQQLLALESLQGDFLTNPRFGQRPNALLVRQEKRISIEVELATGNTLRSINRSAFTITAIDDQGQRRALNSPHEWDIAGAKVFPIDEEDAADNSNNPVIGTFGIVFQPRRNYHSLEIDFNFVQALSGQAVTFHAYSGDFIFNPSFDGQSNTSLLVNPTAYEHAMLAVPDFTKSENHGVMNSGRILPISTDSNILESDQFGAVKIRVQVLTSATPDSFTNSVIVKGRRSTEELIEIFVENDPVNNRPNDNLFLPTSAEAPSSMLRAAKTPAIEHTIEIANEQYRATYALVIRNTSNPAETLHDIQVVENLKAIFGDDIRSFEIISVENAADPAVLLPSGVLTSAAGNHVPLVFNPLFDGDIDRYANLLGLSMEAPREVVTPPLNQQKVAQQARIREAQSGRKKRPETAKFAGAAHNNPNPAAAVGAPAPPDNSAFAPQEVQPTTTAAPEAEQLSDNNPETILLQLKPDDQGNEVVHLGDIALPGLPPEIITHAQAPEATPAENPLSISLDNLELQRDDADAVNGILVEGSVTINDATFRIFLKVLKSTDDAGETSWEFTAIFNFPSLSLNETSFSASLPEAVRSISLSGNELQADEVSRLDQLNSEDVRTTGSIAAANDFVNYTISKLTGNVASLFTDFATDPEGQVDSDLVSRLTEARTNAESPLFINDVNLAGQLEEEVEALQDPYPSLHTHARQPIRQVLAIAEDLEGKSDIVKQKRYVAMLAHLLDERDSRQGERMELNTRKLLGLGFAISTMGEPNSKINPGVSIGGAISIGSLSSDMQMDGGGAEATYFVNLNPADNSHTIEAGLEVTLEGSTDPALIVARNVFGLPSFTIFLYKNQDEVGIKAEALARDMDQTEVLRLMKAIFGVQEIFLSLEGSNSDGGSQIEFEGRALINLSDNQNPLLKVVHDLFGLKTIDLVIAADRGGGSTGVSMVATGILSLQDATTPLMVFLRDDVFGLGGVEVDLITIIEVAKVGSRTSIGVSAEIVINIVNSENEFFKFIRDFFGIQEVSVLIEVDENSFGVRITFTFDKVIDEVHKLTEIYIATLLEYRPPKQSIKLGITFLLDTGSGIINLNGTLGVELMPSTVAVTGSLGMQGEWRNPLGIEGLVLLQVIVELGLSPLAPWITKIGLAAQLRIGKAFMAIAVKIELTNPSKSGFVGEIRDLNMLDMVNTLTGPQNQVPQALQGVLREMTLHHFFLSVIPDPPLTIGEEPTQAVYNEEGITALCDLNFWGFEAFGYLQINYTDGITAFASFSAFELIPGVLKIGSMSEVLDGTAPTPTLPSRFVSKGGPEMFIKLNPYEAPTIFLQGEVTILNMLTAGAIISISGERLYFLMRANLMDLFIIHLEVDVQTDFSSLYIKAEMQNDFFTKLRTMAIDRINELRDAALAELDAAQAEVDKLWDDVEARRKVVKAAFDAAQAKLRSARRDVQNASRKVDSLRGDIRRLDRWFDNLSWGKQILRGIDYGIRKGAMEVAYGVAKGALWIAEQFLYGLELTISIIPVDLDPVIIGLKAAYGIATAALEIAKLGVKGFAAVATGLANLALGGFFDIRYARFEADYSVGVDGKFDVEMEAVIVFLGNPIHIFFRIDLKALENGVNALIEELMAGD